MNMKTFTLMCIIQNLLQYYIKQIRNVNPLKPKIMKLTYTRKVAFNINRTTMHSRLATALKNNYNDLKAFSDEKRDILIKIHD